MAYPPENRRETGGRDVAGRFVRGTSGNPGGRPRRERIIGEMLDHMAPEILARAYEAGMKESTADRKLILDRGAPVPRGGGTTLDLGGLGTPADCQAAIQRIADAMGAGDIAPADTAPLLALVETARRTIETVDLAARVRELEEIMRAQR